MMGFAVSLWYQMAIGGHFVKSLFAAATPNARKKMMVTHALYLQSL